MKLLSALMLFSVAMLGTACTPAPAPMTDAQRTAIVDGVRAAHEALWASFPRLNVDSTMAFYVADDRVTVAELGMIYPSRDSVVKAIRAAWAGFRSISATPAEPRIMVLGPNAAVLTTTYVGSFTDTAGMTGEVRGAWSAVYHRSPDGWKVVQTHESMPVPAPSRAGARRR